MNLKRVVVVTTVSVSALLGGYPLAQGSVYLLGVDRTFE